MNILSYFLLMLLAICSLTACVNSTGNRSQSSSPSGIPSKPSAAQEGLTTEKVEKAVSSMLSEAVRWIRAG